MAAVKWIARIAVLATVVAVPVGAGAASCALAADDDPVVPPVVQIGGQPRTAAEPSLVAGPSIDANQPGSPDRVPSGQRPDAATAPPAAATAKVLAPPQVVPPAPKVSDDAEDDGRPDRSDDPGVIRSEDGSDDDGD